MATEVTYPSRDNRSTNGDRRDDGDEQDADDEPPRNSDDGWCCQIRSRIKARQQASDIQYEAFLSDNGMMCPVKDMIWTMIKNRP